MSKIERERDLPKSHPTPRPPSPPTSVISVLTDQMSTMPTPTPAHILGPIEETSTLSASIREAQKERDLRGGIKQPEVLRQPLRRNQQTAPAQPQVPALTTTRIADRRSPTNKDPTPPANKAVTFTPPGEDWVQAGLSSPIFNSYRKMAHDSDSEVIQI